MSFNLAIVIYLIGIERKNTARNGEPNERRIRHRALQCLGLAIRERPTAAENNLPERAKSGRSGPNRKPSRSRYAIVPILAAIADLMI